MADAHLRELERRAEEGDEKAAAELLAARRRSGQGEPPCERCGEWHQPARASYCFGPINLERAESIARASAEQNHPHPTRLGKPVNMSPESARRLRIRREHDVASTLAWVRQEAETGHLLTSLRACDGCQAFLVVRARDLHRWTGEGTWRDRARRAVSIVKLLLPPCATPAEKRSKLSDFRLDVPRTRGGTSWLNKVWQEEVRLAFPELARPRKAYRVPGEVVPPEGPTLWDPG